MNKENIKSMFDMEGPCISYMILACSIFVCTCFVFWLYTESDIEKLRDYHARYNVLFLHERFEDAGKFHSEVLASIYDDEIDKIWWDIIRKEHDGYEKLQFYSRLLAGNPGIEKIYHEIAAILVVAPEEFSRTQMDKYLTSLKEIRGVHPGWLEKYDLVFVDDEK